MLVVKKKTKKTPTNTGDKGHRFDPRLGDPLEGRYGSPRQYSCLENPTDRGAWRATVHGVTESDTTDVSQQAQLLNMTGYILRHCLFIPRLWVSSWKPTRTYYVAQGTLLNVMWQPGWARGWGNGSVCVYR